MTGSNSGIKDTIVNLDKVPARYKKKVATGRWRWISKVLEHGNLIIVGLEQKSTGREIWI